MKPAEQIRVKVFKEYVVIGIIGKYVFNDIGARYRLFEENAPRIAKMFGCPRLSETMVDGMGMTHTQIWKPYVE